MSGFVSIVGAGPGDPELLTLRAVRRLEEADVVLYDALVLAESLEHAPRARRIFVGKRADRPSTRQEAIHRLLIRLAKSGARVVRLKGGDPFVLGRGGEEALALADAGVAFEVVPGVSSAVAAPALAGIPVTHRGLSSAFAVVSGHAESTFTPVIESAAPNGLTLVVLMGLASRASLARALLERGWRPDTPAAVVQAASTPEQRAWTGELSRLADAPVAPGLAGTLVIGEVVSLSERIAGGAHVLRR